MQRFILNRVIEMVMAVVAVSIIVFLLARLSGNPLDVMLPMDATENDRVILAAELGLDQPLVVQYGLFMSHAVRGDFGKSIKTGRPVIDVVQERLAATIELGLLSMLISLLIALPIGVYSAVRRGGTIDFISRIFAALGQSMPAFWLGIMLIYLFAVTLRWTPSAGMGTPAHFVLPAITLGWYLAAGITRLTRSSMLDVLGAEYIKLARIKGVSEFKVIWKHAFKNAVLPVLTFAAMLLVLVLGGTIIVETVFAWPGVGRLVMESVSFRDFPVVQTVVLMLSVMYVMANLLVDIAYAYLNPKVRYSK